jgi:hypothetical protein
MGRLIVSADKSKVESLLGELSVVTAEEPSKFLCNRIKKAVHSEPRTGKQGVSIVINLRVSKIAAAVMIIGSVILLAGIFNTDEGGLFEDAGLLVKYFAGGESLSNSSAASALSYEYLRKSGQNVVYYGDNKVSDPNSVVMHWQLEDGGYNVLMGDFTVKRMTADELISIQSEMLLKSRK